MKQICYTTQQTAVRVVNEYTNDELDKRANLRGIPTGLPISERRRLLEKAIAEEMFILEISQLTLESPPCLNRLAKTLGISTNQQIDSVHLAWEIAMVIVRDDVAYQLDARRKLRILRKRQDSKIKVYSEEQ